MIKRIRIQNYKSLRDVTVDLDPVTVLIGRSGTGKSNVVNAIRFLRDYLTQRSDRFVADREEWGRLLSATASEPKVAFTVEFEVSGVHGDFAYRLVLACAGGLGIAGLQEETLELAQQPLFSHMVGKWLHPPGMAAPPAPNGLMLGVLYGIPEVKIAHLALTKGIGCYDFPGDVLTTEPSRQRVSPGAANGLTDSADNYLAAFDAIANNLSELPTMREMHAALRKLNTSVNTVELETLQRSHIIVGHKVADAKVLSFKLVQESEGFRRFLAHLIALYQVPPKQTLVFEEPEKGIFPGALSVLAEYFRSCADRGRSQVILTTHSPQLLSHFPPEQIRVVEMDQYETKIGPVSKEQLEALKDQLLTTEELLTVDTARLDPALAKS